MTSANVPKPILERLSHEILAIAKETEFRDWLQARGMESVVDGTPDIFRKLIVSETARWRQVIQKAGIKPVL